MSSAENLRLHRITFFLLSVLLFLVCLSHAPGARAASIQTPSVRAHAYELEIHSGRSGEQPKISGLWAYGHEPDSPYRVLLPHGFLPAMKLLVHYQWSPGTHWAGQSERVELLWRKGSSPWRSEVLGEGFRDPTSGHLLLFPTEIDLSDGQSGKVELKFVIQLENGVVVQDGGEGAVIRFESTPRAPESSLLFRSDWKTTLTGRLMSGHTFELHYDTERLMRQMNLQGSSAVPWSLAAHVQFDDSPFEEYPLVAVIGGTIDAVVPFIPTIVIPRNARRMAIWFLAFHNSQSYFDSNYGLNFNFEIAND